MTFTKLTEFEWEKEYRTMHLWPAPVDDETRKTKVPQSAYKELIVGVKVDTIIRNELLSIAKSVNPLIEIKIAHIIDDKIEIKPHI